MVELPIAEAVLQEKLNDERFENVGGEFVETASERLRSFRFVSP